MTLLQEQLVRFLRRCPVASAADLAQALYQQRTPEAINRARAYARSRPDLVEEHRGGWRLRPGFKPAERVALIDDEPLAPGALRYAREWLELTTAEMGCLLGIETRHIQRWERSEKPPLGPVMEVYRALLTLERRKTDPRAVLQLARGERARFLAQIFALVAGDRCAA